jgi:hypothetical protein
MYGDLLDNDVSAGEMWKNAAIRGGLEAMETVSVMPVSLVSSLKGFQSGKYSESLCIMMLKGTLDTAVGIDWEKTMDKDTTWEMEDYRKMASMAQFMVELPEELPLVGTHTRNSYNKNKVANEELGDFSKTVKPAKLEEAAALAKARIPKLQENLLKRTAKIETQAGAALAKQKLVAKGKRVLLQLKAKDLANAEAENAAAMPTLPVPYGTNPNTLLIQLRLKSILAL